jgi:hypothetical protein
MPLKDYFSCNRFVMKLGFRNEKQKRTAKVAVRRSTYVQVLSGLIGMCSDLAAWAAGPLMLARMSRLNSWSFDDQGIMALEAASARLTAAKFTAIRASTIKRRVQRSEFSMEWWVANIDVFLVLCASLLSLHDQHQLRFEKGTSSLSLSSVVFED